MIEQVCTSTRMARCLVEDSQLGIVDDMMAKFLSNSITDALLLVGRRCGIVGSSSRVDGPSGSRTVVVVDDVVVTNSFFSEDIGLAEVVSQSFRYSIVIWGRPIVPVYVSSLIYDGIGDLDARD
jgi:hypothetical protein